MEGLSELEYHNLTSNSSFLNNTIHAHTNLDTNTHLPENSPQPIDDEATETYWLENDTVFQIQDLEKAGFTIVEIIDDLGPSSIPDFTDDFVEILDEDLEPLGIDEDLVPVGVDDSEEVELMECQEEVILDDTDTDDEADDPNWMPPPPPAKKAKVERKMTFVQKAIKNPEFSAVCMAQGMTPWKTCMMTTAMNFSNQEPNIGNSKTTIYNEQRKHSKIFADRVRDKIKAQVTEKNGASFIQWDEKCLDNATQQAFEANHIERCAVTITNLTGNYLLAIAKAVSSAGSVIAKTVVDLIMIFGLIGIIMGMVFDTTSSNTGFTFGAASIIERILNRNLLYLACRHHVYEVFLKTAFELIVTTSDGPYIKIVKCVKDMWPAFNYNDPKPLKLPKRIKPILENLKQPLITYYRSILDSQVRKDYREAAELALVLLGQEVTSFKKPGGDSNARWMAKFLYSAKAYLFSHQIGLNNKDRNNIAIFLVFCVYVYLPAWFKTPFICEAAVTDLQFANSLAWFKKIRPDMSAEILKKLNNHSWYLGGELAWMSIFSKDVTSDLQKQIVSKKF